MTLGAGSRLGVYEVSAKIGEGGMGEVYQARDTKLDRDVALKVLPEAFTSDPARLACFKLSVYEVSHKIRETARSPFPCVVPPGDLRATRRQFVQRECQGGPSRGGPSPVERGDLTWLSRRDSASSPDHGR